ncbi:hypothetical protein DXG01_015609 [Tephrocybe rancida]|nr:hypothetical protein DXG01_015609 [Tephrocybe rancida]
MAPPSLPADILDVVIETLVRGMWMPGEYIFSRMTLKKCALVSRSHTARVQRHLFSSIDVASKHISAKLSKHLAQNPHLELYIQCLHIDDFDPYDFDRSQRPFLEEEHLVHILSVSTNLRKLTISTSAWHFIEPYKDLSTVLKTALLARFRTITSLKIEWLCDLPMHLIASCAQLKELEIRTVEGHNHLVPEVHHLHPAEVCHLEYLKVDRPECLAPLMIPPHQHPLETLCIARAPMSSVLGLLCDAQHSLRVLEIFATNDTPNLQAVVLDLPLLEFITFGISPVLGQSPLTFLVFILESGSFTLSRVLKRVSILLCVTDGHNACIHSDWGRIDAALTHSRYQKFEELAIRVNSKRDGGRFDEDLYKMTIELNLRRSLPLLYAHNKVTLEMTMDTVDRYSFQ